MIENITNWLIARGYQDRSIKYIENIRRSEPARRVRSNGKNVSGTYPSKKMGLSIQFESHSLELAGIFEKEFDSCVLEYYDQPPSFKINYKVNEKNIGHLYTADFFVISECWVGWEEWKTEEDLIKLSIKSPERYQVDGNGNWRCPPAEKYAESLGLSFKVKSSKELNWTYIRNVKFLGDYLLADLALDEKIIGDISHLVDKKPGITIKEILSLDNINADDLYAALILDHIYIDIKQECIPDLTAKIYSSKEYKEAYYHLITTTSDRYSEMNVTFELKNGEKILWDEISWTILNAGSSNITLLSNEKNSVDIPIDTFEHLLKQGKIKGIKSVDLENPKEFELLKSASSNDLKEANEKYNIILPFLKGEKITLEMTLSVTKRTIQNWISKYRSAEKRFGNGFVGLLPQNKKKGNRKKRIAENVQEKMDIFIMNEYENLKQPNLKNIYYKFKNECLEEGHNPPSYYTFTKSAKNISKYDHIKNRKGAKAAYSKGEFYYELSQKTPRHGDRIFEICHIDHTELDIELRCSLTGKNLGRPWLTLLTDAYSRRILSIYVSFDPPSYRSCMMALRECVKRFSRFPSGLVVDGGKEFRSIYFDTLLSRNRCVKKTRPGNKPRFGNVIERIFGTTHSAFVYNLTGNTQLMKNVRQVSKNVNPKNLSIWTLEKFVEVLKKWVYEIYDLTMHSSIGVSPREKYEYSLMTGGERETVRVIYDDVFKILTLPTTRKGTAKVIPGYGVKVNRIYYYDSVFRNGLIENTNVEVRYDPFNLGVAYAFVNNRWTQLRSEKYNIFKNCSEKEMSLVFEELKRRKKLSNGFSDITIKMVADFLKSVDAEEVLLKQRLKDRGMRNLYLIDGGKNNDDTKGKDKSLHNENENVKLVIDNDNYEIEISNLEYEAYEGL